MKQKMLGSIALAGVLSLSVAGTTLASDYHSPFTDLSPNSWCYGYVTSMVGHNFLSGYPDKTFRQDALITRAETEQVRTASNHCKQRILRCAIPHMVSRCHPKGIYIRCNACN